MPEPLYGALYRTWMNPDGTFRLEFLSGHAEQLLEVTAPELAAQFLSQTLPLFGIDVADFYQRMEDSIRLNVPWTVEFGYIGPKSGTRRWFRAQDFPQVTSEGVPHFAGVLIDITGLKDAESQARAAYQRLSAHLKHTPLAVVKWDSEARIRRWSGLAEQMFGWTAEEVLGRTIYELRFIHESDVDRVRGIVGELLQHRVPGNVCRNRNYHKSGRVVNCLWHNSAHLDDAGQIISVLSLAQDLTEQSAIEEELTLSEERLRTSLRFAGMLSWDYDVQKGSMHYSQDMREYFGVPDMAVGGELEFAMAHPDDRARIIAEVDAARKTHDDFRIEYRGVEPDAEGRVRWFASRGSFVTTSDGRVARSMGVTSNISERKRIDAERAALDDELREARHLESLGLIAGGIAHDFNNLLTIILGNAGVVKMLTEGDTGIGRNLEEIESACERAADLCGQISAYAGVGRMLTTTFDLNALLRESEVALHAVVGRQAILKWHLFATPCPIVGEARQIRQAVINVLTNAAEAMDSVGEIHLHTDRCILESSPEGFAPAISPGEYAILRIVDSGRGMSEAIREKAFRALYSTKFTGRGLGLAAVYGIVRDHKGSVRLRSQPGVGTTVEILLPLARNAGFTAAMATTQTDGAPRLVLVVDDDANIRELICSVLEDDGYTVRAAANGRDALTLFHECPGAFVLAVVDLMMPGIAGNELIGQLRLLHEGLPTLIVSGFAERELPYDIQAGGPTLVLPKPFRLDQLSETVKRFTSATMPS